MDVVTIVIIAVLVSAVTGFATYFIVRKSTEKRSKTMLKEAESEAEMIRKEKILQAKERFIQLKAEHEKAVNERNGRIAQVESKLKERERGLNQRADELQKKDKELAAQREHLESQAQALGARQEELDRKFKEQIALLEQISGMSSEEAKNVLIESLKTEAKGDAMT